MLLIVTGVRTILPGLNFRMVLYQTVLRLIDLLSDDKYDTVPKQPPPSVPTKQQQSQKTKAELKQKPAATGGVAPSTSSSATSLHEVPPPEHMVWNVTSSGQENQQ